MVNYDENRPVLTERQQGIYNFLKDKILNRGYGPTVREIGAHFGIKSPNGVMCHLKALEKKGMITREPHMSRAIQLKESPSERASLPLAGQIAAGKPVLAEELTEKVDFASLFDPETHFCMKVIGKSLGDEQIADGDYVIFSEKDKARNGDLVLTRVDDKNVSLNRYYKQKNRVRLEPTNKRMKPFSPSNLKILGVLSGVVRSYN